MNLWSSAAHARVSSSQLRGLHRSRRVAGWVALGLVAALAFGSVAAAARTPRPGWMTFYVARSAASVQLPQTWRVRAPTSPEVRLEATNAPTTAWLAVLVGPNRESWPAFRSRMYKIRRVEELARDPRASVRSRVVTLPAGRAVETIAVSFNQSVGERLYGVQFDFLRNGVQYEFEYFCLNKATGVYVPVFDASARSIRLN